MGGVAIVVGAVVGYVVAHVRSGVVFTRSGVLRHARHRRARPGRARSTTGSRSATSATSGLTKRAKMGGLLVVAVGFAVACVALDRRRRPTLAFTRWDDPAGTSTRPSAGWCSAVLLIAGSTNAVNLTDGLDGLAAGLVDLRVHRLHGDRRSGRSATPTSTRSTTPSTWRSSPPPWSAACAGFLWWNAAPGADLHGRHRRRWPSAPASPRWRSRSTRSCCCRSSAALFVFETLSVIMQVGSFRLFGRRRVPHGADPPPLRAGRLAGDDRDHPLLDPGRHVHGGGARHLLRRLDLGRHPGLTRAAPIGPSPTGRAGGRVCARCTGRRRASHVTRRPTPAAPATRDGTSARARAGHGRPGPAVRRAGVPRRRVQPARAW